MSIIFVLNGKEEVAEENKNGSYFFRIDPSNNPYKNGQKIITENRNPNFEIEITGFGSIYTLYDEDDNEREEQRVYFIYSKN